MDLESLLAGRVLWRAVVALDLRPYPLAHPRLTCVREGRSRAASSGAERLSSHPIVHAVALLALRKPT